MLLTWSSIAHGQPLRVLSEWASSGDGLELHQQMIRDLQPSQKPEQLALTLAALLCHARLLPYTSNDTAQPIKGCYLADLDALLNGHSLSNRRVVFERMGSALLHILHTFGDEYRDMIQLLAIVLGKEAPMPESFDGFTEQYLVGRVEDQLTHNSAFKKVWFLCLTEAMPELSMDGEEWIMVPSQSYDNSA